MLDWTAEGTIALLGMDAVMGIDMGMGCLATTGAGADANGSNGLTTAVAGVLTDLVELEASNP